MKLYRIMLSLAQPQDQVAKGVHGPGRISRAVTIASPATRPTAGIVKAKACELPKPSRRTGFSMKSQLAKWVPSPAQVTAQ